MASDKCDSIYGGIILQPYLMLFAQTVLFFMFQQLMTNYIIPWTLQCYRALFHHEPVVVPNVEIDLSDVDMEMTSSAVTIPMEFQGYVEHCQTLSSKRKQFDEEMNSDASIVFTYLQAIYLVGQMIAYIYVESQRRSDVSSWGRFINLAGFLTNSTLIPFYYTCSLPFTVRNLYSNTDTLSLLFMRLALARKIASVDVPIYNNEKFRVGDMVYYDASTYMLFNKSIEVSKDATIKTLADHWLNKSNDIGKCVIIDVQGRDKFKVRKASSQEVVVMTRDELSAFPDIIASRFPARVSNSYYYCVLLAVIVADVTFALVFMIPAVVVYIWVFYAFARSYRFFWRSSKRIGEQSIALIDKY